MYKDREELEDIYINLKIGDEIKIVRDLSMGEMRPEMIQELVIKVFDKNKKDVLYIIRNFPIIDFILLN